MPNTSASRVAAWRAANPERVKASAAAWRDANSEKLRAYRATYYAANRDKALAASAAWRVANPEKVRASTVAYLAANGEKVRAKRAAADRKWKYCLTAEMYDALSAAQNGRCALCERARPLHVDHDHRCCAGPRTCGRCVRGLLCQPCNLMLGRGKDQPLLLRRAADYLEKHA